MEIFTELAAIVFIALTVSFLMRILKQPLIVGYIIAGILAGPQFLNAIHNQQFIEILSKIGIMILLFIVGLQMSPRVIKEVGKVSLLTGIGQVILTALVGYGISVVLGMKLVEAMYLAIALTFSSTIIVLKLLSDKGHLNKLYGKISIGFLLVQDIIAAFVLIGISTISTPTNMGLALTILVVALKAIQLVIAIYLITVHLLPRVVKYAAHSQELLFLFSIAWGFALASVLYLYGFSAEIGALVAGVTLSMTPYAYEIGSRLKPLRDFFIVLFFVLVGSQMHFETLQQIILPTIVFSLFVLIGKPIIMIMIMHLLGYKRKTSFLTGVITAQISEFSLILAAFGMSLGQLSQTTSSLISVVGLITIAGSTYLILYADNIYQYVEQYVKLFEIRKPKEETPISEPLHEILLFGFDRVGQDFVNLFKKLHKDYLVIDFNPASLKEMEQSGIPARYGDAEDVEFLQSLHLHEIKMSVSTIPDFKVSMLLLKKIRSVNKTAIVILLCHDISEAVELYKNGANYVMLPHYLSAKHTVHMIDKLGFDKKEFDEEKEKHLAYIQEKEMPVQ